MRRSWILPAVCALTISACDQPTSTTLTAPSPDLDRKTTTPEFDLQEPLQPEPGTYVMLAGAGQLAGAVAEAKAAGGTVTFQHAPTGFAIVTGLDEAGAAALGGSANVSGLIADEVFAFEAPEVVGTLSAFDPEEPGKKGGQGKAAQDDGASVASPGDPTTASRFPSQWNMRAIDADQAWAAGRLGSSDVTVAILDTGIDYLYPDLVGRVDLDRSVSFLARDNALLQDVFPGRHPITDLHYHGTHVASTVASNGTVVAGVTSQVELFGVKVCSVFGGCPGSAIFGGILYAADAGADVINMSLGGAFLRANASGFGSVIQSVFNYAAKAGVTVVVSAGNASADLDRNFYPNQDDEMTHFPSLFVTYCDTPTVMCVAATGPTSGGTFTTGPWTDVDAPAVYTNYGRNAINVAAPGGNIGASVVAACSGASLVIPVCQTGVFVLGISGTSMAAPHVTGLAALLVEDLGRDPSQIKTRIQQAADDLGESGVDPFYGKGRINVADALEL